MSTFFKALEQAELERALRQGVPGETPRPGAGHPVSIPVLDAEIAADPPVPGRVDARLVSLLRPASPAAEQYRGLAHAIHHLRQTTGLGVLAVTSPARGDGTTTTAINLAGTLAQSPGTRVLLVDLDLRTGTAAARLGLGDGPRPGLAEAIRRPEVPLEDVVRRCEPYNLSVLSTGARLADPYELLASARLGELLHRARQLYDYVVVDTPPVASVLDGRVIGQWVDRFLVVVSAHGTPRRLLEHALNLLEPSHVLGLVFNDAERGSARPRGRGRPHLRARP
jgi:capsular exopolysaccharide synthesis family protein